MSAKVVDIQKYKETKLAEKFINACSKSLPKEEVPTLEKLVKGGK